MFAGQWKIPEPPEFIVSVFWWGGIVGLLLLAVFVRRDYTKPKVSDVKAVLRGRAVKASRLRDVITEEHQEILRAAHGLEGDEKRRVYDNFRMPDVIAWYRDTRRYIDSIIGPSVADQFSSGADDLARRPREIDAVMAGRYSAFLRDKSGYLHNLANQITAEDLKYGQR